MDLLAFQNDKVKFYTTNNITNYAQNNGTKLNITCYLAITNNDIKSYVLIKGTDIIYESQNIEQIGVHIDMLKFKEEC